jgi:predicted RNase H-like nuclease (RuvC/YqgF family)
MTDLNTQLGFQLLVTLGSPMNDILAIAIFAFPLAALAIILLVYQRHLPRETLKRNLMVISGIAFLCTAFIGVLFAASSALPSPWHFGSWDTYSRGLQLLVDLVFGSVTTSLFYILGCILVFAIIAHFIIAAPEPDLVGLRSELKAAKDEAKLSNETVQRLEVDNKRLNEFLSEKEKSLANLEGELERIKAEISEREDSISLMEEQLKTKAVPSDIESKLRAQLKEKDVSLESLQSEIADLKLILENTKAGPVSSKGTQQMSVLEKTLHETQTRWADLIRRAETASEVSDSVISDLVELISQVQSSKKEDSAKQTLVALIEGLGRSMTRVSREIGDVRADEPRVEMIGAIIMTNEIVDAIKKMIRQ